MSKKFGLGKGLNALIPEDTVILEPKKGKDKNDDNGYSLDVYKRQVKNLLEE